MALDDGGSVALNRTVAERSVSGIDSASLSDDLLDPDASRPVLPGPDDGKVKVAGVQPDCVANHRVVHTSHGRLASHPAAIAATMTSLRRGTVADAATSSGPGG